MNKCRLAYVCPAIGGPQFELKRRFLHENLQQLVNENLVIDLFVNVYDDSDLIETEFAPSLVRLVKLYRGAGILAELMRRNMQPSLFSNYDFILLILDDVKLLDDFKLDEIIQIYKEHDLDIFSPALSTNSLYSRKNMLTRSSRTLRIRRACEFFCYLMTPTVYRTYFHYLSDDEPWMWSLESLLMQTMHLRVGLSDCHTIFHAIKSQGIRNRIKAALDSRRTRLKHKISTVDFLQRRMLHTVCIEQLS